MSQNLVTYLLLFYMYFRCFLKKVKYKCGLYHVKLTSTFLYFHPTFQTHMCAGCGYRQETLSQSHFFLSLFLPGMRNAIVKRRRGTSSEGKGQLHEFSLAQACTHMHLVSSVAVCVHQANHSKLLNYTS